MAVSRSYRIFFALFMLIALATVLRVYRIDFGLPEMYHPDEQIASSDVYKFMHGDYVIHRFNHPLLFRDIAFGCLKDLDYLLPTPLSTERKYATLALRWVSAIAGILTVLMLYFLGREFLYPSFAFFCALLYALLPLAVFCSKYGTPDMLLSLLFILNLFLQLKLYNNRSKLLYFINGLCLTIAFFVKYNACFLLISFCCAHILAVRKEDVVYRRSFVSSDIASFIFGILLGVFIGFPFFQVDSWIDVVQSLSFEATRLFRNFFQSKDKVAILNVPGSYFLYMFHFRYSILPTTGIALFVCIIGGLITILYKRSGKYLILLAVIIPYYIITEIITKVPVNSDRYILPILSLYVLCAMIFCQTVYQFLKKKWGGVRNIIYLFIILLMVYPGYKTVRYLIVIEPDTREIMERWIVHNIPVGSTIFFHWSRRSSYPRLRHDGYNIILPKIKEQINYSYIKTKSDYVLVSRFDDTFFTYPDDLLRYKKTYPEPFPNKDLLFEAKPSYETYLYHNPTIQIYKITEQEQ